MLNTAVRNTNKIVRSQVKESGKRIGNHFTKKDTARLMSTLASYDGKEEVSILDPGAGTGILSAGIVEELCKKGAKEIYLDAYETDVSLLPMLELNLKRVRRICFHNYQVKFRFHILNKDFLLEYANSKEESPKYDYVIMTPDDDLSEKEEGYLPQFSHYFSIPVTKAYLFLAAAINAVNSNGQLIAYIPTEFATGDSVMKLRKEMLQSFALNRIHLFSVKDKIGESNGDTRDKLKKNMILYVQKGKAQGNVQISDSYDDGAEVTLLPEQTYEFCVRGDEKRLILVQSERELRIVNTMESLPETLKSLGFTMHTGVTLTSRYPGYLSKEPMEDYIPLITAGHMQEGHVQFPLRDKTQYVYPVIPSLKQVNCNMLLIKRVPSKADNRHLCSVVYLAAQAGKYSHISTDNKVVYLQYQKGDLNEAPVYLLYGLFALFNSTTYECYLSILSKSKQVNSKEYTGIPLPEESVIKEIGKRMAQGNRFSQKASDIYVKAALHLEF